MTTDQTSPLLWATERDNLVTDWIEFKLGGDTYRINVSFMLSNYTCIFGRGCPSVLLKGANSDGGCCQIGVSIADEDEFFRVDKYVQMLTEEDADNIAEIRRRWHRPPEDNNDFKNTRVIDGLCIMSNRVGGATGKPGCAFRALSTRLGVSHMDVEPDICWQLPMAVTNEEYEDGTTTWTVDATAGSVWANSRYVGAPIHSAGWFCTETPDAYVGTEAVYIAFMGELLKLLGEPGYWAMVDCLKEIEEAGGRRSKMPGETINGGRPLIPVMVQERVHKWNRVGSKNALRRSEDWLNEHPEQRPETQTPPVKS